MSKEIKNTPFNHYRDLLARYQNLNYITPMQDGNIMRAMQDLESEIRQEFSSLMDKWVSDVMKIIDEEMAKYEKTFKESQIGAATALSNAAYNAIYELKEKISSLPTK